MKRRKINWLFFVNNKGFAEGETPPDEKDLVPREEFDKVSSRAEKAERDLEDVRMEILTPEYMAFLDSKDKGKDDEDKDLPKKDIPVDDFEKLSKKQLFEMAKSAAVEEMNSKWSKDKEEAKKESDSRVKREIAAFAKTHSDYEMYRPTMYGLSTRPEHADKSLQELYKEAKEHIKSIHAAPTEEEKEKSRKSSGEKPGGDNDSFEKIKNMSNDQIAMDAAREVEQSLGPLPSA